MRDGRERRIAGTHWFLLRAHWASGLLPLFFLTEISRLALAAAAAAFLAGAILDWKGFPRGSWNRASTPLVAMIVAGASLDVAIGSGDLLVSASLLVLGVQSIKFLLPKNHRDGWQLCAIAFLEFLAAAASTTEIRFAAFLFVFLGLSAGAMWALQAEEAAEAEGTAVPPTKPGFAALLLLSSAVAGAFLTAILFMVTPRVGIGHFLRGLGTRGGFTGFSEEITLSGVTAIKVDRRVVARIEFPDLPPGVSPPGLYLRGATYSRFDGTKWTRGWQAFQRVPKAGYRYFLSPGRRSPLASAEIFLEPMGHSALFVYGETMSIEGALGDMRTDGRGNYRLPDEVSAAHYRVHFHPFGSAGPDRSPHRDPAYLELPSGSDAIRDLAAGIVSPGAPDAEKADRAVRHLRSGFRYTLTDVSSSVEDFLFGKKAGFCEHYAAALTLILRAAGIPARVAAGYLGGEWSDVGQYLIVRQSDAHAWTEAWIDGGWVTLDATPPLGEQSPFFARTGTVGMYLDWARQRWAKYVVNYSLRMQAEAVSGGWLALRRSGNRVRSTIRDHGRAAAQGTAAAALAAAALVLVLRRRRGRSPGQAGRDADACAPLPRPYARLHRRLSAADPGRSPGAAMESMLMKAAAGKPGILSDAGRFLDLYHRDRFGPDPLPADEFSEARRLADRLRRALARKDAG